MATESIPLKQCRNKERCINPLGSWLPATDEYFHRDKAKKDGFVGACKVCKCAQVRQYQAEHMPEAVERVRLWRLANPEKLAILRENEKQSNHEWHRRDRIEHPEKYKLYAETHAEEIAATKREWRKNNPNKVKKHRSESQKRNRASANARVKRWRKRHPEQARLYARLNQQQRNHLPGKATKADIELQYKAQGGRCWWCGCKLPETITQGSKTRVGYDIDHRIPVTREHSTNDASNLVLSCVKCNDSRQNKLPQEWNGRLL